MSIQRGSINEKGRRKMAVSKATLSFISADVGARLVKDIDKTTINTGLLKECEGILAKLSKHKGKKI